MPATMMHLYAAHVLNPKGSDSYFLGSILPDCVDAHRELKDHLHFRDVPPESRLQSLIRFGKALDLTRDFDFGALYHFYLDYLWDNGPQKAHRKMHGEENWFPDYRKELHCAGSRTAQRMPWSKELWHRLHKPAPELYANTMDLPEDEIHAFLEFNFHWHTEETLPESEVFTDDLVDSFIRRSCTAFAVFLRDFFPETYKARSATFPPLGGI
ncbi:MAG: hypothetical protein E7580_06260 [Ruminococcaceae bacterium]|nr:hypothetical protein [Oscillospiraceae bacterium]